MEEGPAGKRAQDSARRHAGPGLPGILVQGREDAPLPPAGDSRHNREREEHLRALPLGGGDPAAVVQASSTYVDEPHLSPDGGWLAYMSSESGRYEVYVETFGRDGDRVRVSVDGGGQPRWRGDGRELFYATPTGRLMAVAVRVAGDRPEVSLPVELFEVQGMRPSGEFDDYAGEP